MGKTFLLGVGAQKAGTTWMHQYLSNHKNVDMGFAKEYHIFDGLYIPKTPKVEKYETQAIAQLQGGLSKYKNSKALRCLAFYSDLDLYFSYFTSLLQAPNVQLTGDYTPAYSGLPEEAFRKIRDEFTARGIPVKVLFLMRDPVDRVISMSRMEIRKQNLDRSSDNEARVIEKNYTKSRSLLRTRYNDTIKRLESVFKADDIKFEFFETLFQIQKIEEISTFLGIDTEEPDFSSEYNVSRTKNEISDELRAKVAQEYRGVYNFCMDRFGENKIRSIWQNSQFI
ncbi:MAG: sulfotransferase domain-containing protein [Pseudomonadota bacterium]